MLCQAKLFLLYVAGCAVCACDVAQMNKGPKHVLLGAVFAVVWLALLGGVVELPPAAAILHVTFALTHSYRYDSINPSTIRHEVNTRDTYGFHAIVVLDGAVQHTFICNNSTFCLCAKFQDAASSLMYVVAVRHIRTALSALFVSDPRLSVECSNYSHD